MTPQEMYQKNIINTAYGKAISAILKIESFMEERKICPATISYPGSYRGDLRKRFSIYYDLEDSEFRAFLLPCGHEVPFFSFFSHVEAEKVIKCCRKELIDIFDYFLIYRGEDV